MFYSGLVVICREGRLDDIEASVSSLEGCEVHQRDETTSRLVVVIEGETIDRETELFQQIRSMDGVIDASLVVHREDNEEQVANA